MMPPAPDSAPSVHLIEQGISTREISLLKGGTHRLLDAARASLPSVKAVSSHVPFCKHVSFLLRDLPDASLPALLHSVFSLLNFKTCHLQRDRQGLPMATQLR